MAQGTVKWFNFRRDSDSSSKMAAERTCSFTTQYARLTVPHLDETSESG